MTHLHLERRTLGIAMVVLAVGVTYASIPGSDGAIHGCYAPGGQLRVIDTDAGQSCHPAEKAIQWAAVAPGCPAGTLPLLSVCIETTARAADFHFLAKLDCADERRRLPQPGELLAFREVDGITLSGSGEWTGDLADTGEPFRYVAISDGGDGVEDVNHTLAYRCVAGPELP